MLRIYVSGPIGANDAGRRARVQAAVTVGYSLLAAGLAPFVPHLWAGYQGESADSAQSYEAWMDYDFVWIGACHALLRIPGYSPGADREVVEAERLDIPVFYSLSELIQWARGVKAAIG